MRIEVCALAAGLHFVATPIGTARDVTLRALDILASADVLAAEDTRALRRLMNMHGVTLGDRPLVAYHDHNGPAVRPRLLRAMAGGRSVAYAPQAGSPLISDPGLQLARAAIADGFAVTAAPGPSAVIAALGVAGLPTDRFLFAGFLPSRARARRMVLAELQDVPATLIFYESPRRIKEMLEDMVQVLGETRDAVVCRELTKRFEEISRGTLGVLATGFSERSVRGEIVVLVARSSSGHSARDMETALKTAMQDMSIRDAAASVATALDLPRRQVYRTALDMGRKP